MPAPAILALPYHVARTPLTVLDMTVLQRLPQNSPVRRSFAKAFGSLDLVAGRVFADQSLLRQGAERLATAAPTKPAEPASDRRPDSEDGPESQASAPPPKKAAPAPSAQAREAVVTKRRPATTRANKNLSTIRQQIAETEAIAEAHEHLAEERAEERAEDSAES